MSDEALSNVDLMAYLDGEAGPELAAQIEQTPAYQPRLQALARREAELRKHLAGVKRPSPLELAEYHLGLLPKPRTRQIKRYLAEHPHAVHQLASLQQFLGPQTPPETAESSFLDRVKTWVASLFPPTGNLQPVGVRGAQEGVYQAGEFQIVLDSEPDPADAGRRVLVGLLVGLEPGRWEAILWQTRHLPYAYTAVPLDEDGNFIISGLPPGEYKLMVRNWETAVQIYLQTSIQ